MSKLKGKPFLTYLTELDAPKRLHNILDWRKRPIIAVLRGVMSARGNQMTAIRYSGQEELPPWTFISLLCSIRLAHRPEEELRTIEMHDSAMHCPLET